MFGSTILSVSALLAVACAQTAPGFPISASQTLGVAYGNNTVSPPGETIPRGETAQSPRISSSVLTSGAPGVLLVVDSDVPRNGTRVQLLHWLASNVTLGSNSTLNVPVGQVPYLQPSPPVGDSPHAYTFILFPQPSNFSIPAQYADLANNRVGFNVSQFVGAARLGQALAANYIRVQNLTGTATMSFPPPRPTSSGAANATSPAAFPGGAQSVMVGGVGLWAVVATAMLAGAAAVAL